MSAPAAPSPPCSTLIRIGPFPAAVIAVVPTANREKATVKVRIGLKQKDPRILPDMAVKVKFLDDGRSQGGAPADAVSAAK